MRNTIKGFERSEQNNFYYSLNHAKEREYIPLLLQINQGFRLVYHPQLVAVYHQCRALYIIIAKAIQPTVDDIRLRR